MNAPQRRAALLHARADPAAVSGDGVTAFICAASVAAVTRHRVLPWRLRIHACFRSHRSAQFGRQSIRHPMSAAAAASEDAPTKPTNGESLQDKIQLYKQFLIISENARPFWYRSLDSVSTALASMCFVTRVVAPPVADAYRLDLFEDFLNVSFLIKFLLLFWTNDWNVAWLFTGTGAFDLASCLPVLTVLARAGGDITLEQTTDILQIFRFLRLLREALPSEERLDRRPVPVGQQIVAVLLSLLGTVVLSATVLYQFETTTDQLMMDVSFEDSLLYMVNIFAGRDTYWYPQTSQAKIASFLATGVGIIFIPFLISRTVELFVTAEGRDMILSKSRVVPDTKGAAGGAVVVSGAQLSSGRGVTVQDLLPWVSLLQRLDVLENAGFTDPQSAAYLRSCCLARDSRLRMLDVCYGQGLSVGSKVSTDAARLFAARLKELVDGDAAASAMQGSASTVKQQQFPQEDLVAERAKLAESARGRSTDEAQNNGTSDSCQQLQEGEGKDAEILVETDISDGKRAHFMSQLKSGIRQLKRIPSENDSSQA